MSTFDRLQGASAPDPRDARIAELEAEVERLRGERVEHIPDECAGHFRRVLQERDDARTEVARLSRRPDLTPLGAALAANALEAAEARRQPSTPTAIKTIAALWAAAEQEGR